MRDTDLSFYAQDNYKVNNRLTLNLGVHYENFLGWPWTEAHHKEYAFVPSISTTALEQVGTNGIPSSGLSGNNANFAPRVGAAYKSPTGGSFTPALASTTRRPTLTFLPPCRPCPRGYYRAFNNSVPLMGPPRRILSIMRPMDMSTKSRWAVDCNRIHPPFAVDPNAKTPYT